MEEKRPRSQEINVSSFHEEPVSSERTGRPVTGRPVNETSVIQARSSEDSKHPNVGKHMKERGDSLLEQTQKMCQIVLKHVLFIKATHSTLETKHFVIDRGNPL